MALGAFDGFVWSVGEEGSDPVVAGDHGPIRHDQYEQSGHYDNLEPDLASIAGLGVELVRYGMPWRLTEPEPGVFNWTRWDRALAGAQAAGLTPIVDLLHFGAWNDRLKSRPDHAKVLANVVLANLEVVARIRADRDGWWIGSEGFDAWVDPTGRTGAWLSADAPSTGWCGISTSGGTRSPARRDTSAPSTTGFERVSPNSR